MWTYELHPPHLLHYLVNVETSKIHVNTTSAFNVDCKIAVTCIKIRLHWQFHRWCLWLQSNQVCIKRFRRSSMSWIFVSYTYCCITLQISKFKAHGDWWPWSSLMKLWYMRHMQFSLVISRCNVTFSVL